MSEYGTHATLGEPGRLRSVPPAPRTFVSAVVTELALVLEPVVRDPFLDNSDDAPRSACGSWRPKPRSRPIALAH